MERHGEPRARNHEICPPPLVELGILVVLVFGHSAAFAHHLLPDGPSAALELPLAGQAQEVAGHAAEPCAVGPEVDACRLGVAAVDGGDEGRADDTRVGKKGDVLESLVGEVAARLQHGDSMQHRICAGLRP